MSATDNCCQTVINLPGPRGATGPAGTNGTNGVNAYMLATANFTMPAEGASGVASTTDNTAFVVGQVVFWPGLGYLGIIAKPTTTTTTLSNLEDTAAGEYVDNAAPGTIGANGSMISPAGLQGPAGTFSGAAGGDLKDNYPNPLIALGNGLGESIWGNGDDAQTQAAGTDGERLMYDQSALLGVRSAKVNLASAAEVTGTLQTSLFPALTGDVTKPAGSTVTTVPAASITYAKIQNVTDARLLGRSSGSAGAPQEISIAGSLTLSAGVLTGANTPSWAYLRHQETAGVDAGGFTSGVGAQIVAINTEVNDDSSIVSLSSNQMTIAAGTYRVRARAPGYQIASHRLQVYDVTNSAVLAYGSSCRCTTDQVDSWLFAKITLAVSTIIKLERFGSATKAVNGCGFAVGNGTEVYAEIWIEKLA